ncbi:glycogen/starch/alpha-glucan phosphorylase [Enterococcus timonensis]|uniref:glycogen/starch/alpha-glucan phosphorylase n=1 Tax=Enterococcus timonensis TaxID=1852364 RepID=UPI0008D99ACF|nr:glycogen/starch/alpha-glucan phosphorylase [Enterococcus timonensis]
MKLTKEQFTEDFLRQLQQRFALSVEDSSNYELYMSLGALTRAYYSAEWKSNTEVLKKDKNKQAYYFSIEFLPGKMLKSNLLSLGILETVKSGLKDLSLNLDEIAKAEPDMALGNGGLGRLASCFMDALASSNFPGNGNGIRYNYGLFKQKFVDGYQVELPDSWLKGGNVWEVRKENKAVNVGFSGQVYMVDDGLGNLKPHYENQQILRAIPYDTPMLGFENDVTNVMRLWTVEIPVTEEGNYLTVEKRRAVEDITAVLYPDDSNYEGRLLRLKQEYFFVSAGLQSIHNYFLSLGLPLSQFPNHVAIHINDTHPALCVPELMRLLLDVDGLSWEKAWDITVKTMSYTNHTIMQEALEKWPTQMVYDLLPRLCQIIQEIDRRFVAEKTPQVGPSLVHRTRILQNDHVHMANLAIIGSHSTNGVAKLHSDLLKNVVLHDFYLLYPERFNNKTNGIAIRRWSQLANEQMSQVLDETIGRSWRKNIDDLVLLKAYQDDPAVWEKLATAKRANKERLSQFIMETKGIEVSPAAIFDVQIKRLHAYKRQLMNLLHILKLYIDLKENPAKKMIPRVFIFGAKAAPSYDYAKTIIKCINEVADLINGDKSISGQIKVVFLENYNVSLAELIIPAADVSEQISLATKEASGTSNMKLMLNGAITVATLDGANVEIRDAVGSENIFIFGLDEQEVYGYYKRRDYNAKKIYDEDPIIQKVLNSFIDGTIPNIQREGREIYESLLTYNDEYFVLRDFAAYCSAQEKISQHYADRDVWQKMSLLNIANASQFSADKTVTRYAEDIWQIDPIF